MKPAKIAVICVAALAAVGLALVVRSMGSSGQQKQGAEVTAPAAATTKVLVAAHDLAPGHQLTAADLVWKDWPAADVHPAFVTDGSVPRPDAAVPTEETKDGTVEKVVDAVVSINSPTAIDSFTGAIVREQILAGEPIQARKIVRAGESGYLAAFLEPGMRAMSIPVSADTAAGGFILPGDRVDVLLTREVDVPSGQDTRKRTVTATVLQNLRVLAIDQSTQAAAEEKAVVGATATVEVNDRDAETLALARAQGDLTIVLRSYADASGPRGLIPGAVRRGEYYGGRTTVAAAGDAGAPNPANDPRAVRIFRGTSEPEVVVLQ
ncbi:Flp pilus assembly protein CpaB [uncultured Brevundimonas sp.]|uniref:Flp pilus assembly protein CpaB n=1 Tax=uncultured Brevundimonas sp. TaxID=213418 RepID=UPI0026382AD1|nr:Flp pilus assembly protein CpaB [uncultured Brevundimonas sp.]